MADYNYEAACNRHLDDAEHLEGDRRFANASQLHGYAAECALLAIAKRSGVGTFGTDGVEGEFRVHVDQLWPAMLSALQHRGHARLYDALGPANPFKGWRTRDRYTATGCAERSEFDRHRQGARRARDVLDKVRAGTLP